MSQPIGTAIYRAQRASRLKRAKKVVKEIFAHKALYIMLLPAVIYSLLFQYKPMYGIIIAFKDFSYRKGIIGSPWVGLHNFEKLVGSYWFPIIIRNTLTVSVLSLVIGFPITIIFALMVNEIGHEGVKRTFQTITYAPHFISTVVMCGMVIMFVKGNTGIINIFIRLLGGESIEFMMRPEMFKWVYVLSGVWQGTGWGAIIYFAALSGVDQSLLEAAEIDGASRLQKIIHINFPVLVPTIMIMLILQCGSLLSVGYEKTLLLQTAGNLTKSEVISTYVYKIGLLEGSDFSFSTATSLLNSVVNAIILISANMISRATTRSSLW